MRPLTSADKVWNRACEGGGDAPSTGDSALAALLLFHGLAMNGGVLHAIECLSLPQLAKSQDGYRFFGLGAVAELLIKASAIAAEGNDLERVESELNQEYWRHVPDDSALVVNFETHYKSHAEEYSPC